jgi:flagellar biosynthesis protein FlhF
MYVRKFEADTIEEALNLVKREMGPDAIILKTVSNKGLKGAFKKKKIEVTAAISENSYEKKIKVDHVLDDEQKEKFYSNNPSSMAKMINQHAKTTSLSTVNKGYGNIGINKAVQQVNRLNNDFDHGSKDGVNHEQLSNSLDSFLKQPKVSKNEPGQSMVQEFVNELPERQVNPRANIKTNNDNQNHSYGQRREGTHESEELSNKLIEMEKMIYELKYRLDLVSKNYAAGIMQLRLNLKSLQVDDEFIELMTKKILFELPKNDHDNFDTVYEFCLREMINQIKTDLPLFSKIDTANDQPAITVFCSKD